MEGTGVSFSALVEADAGIKDIRREVGAAQTPPGRGVTPYAIDASQVPKPQAPRGKRPAGARSSSVAQAHESFNISDVFSRSDLCILVRTYIDQDDGERVNALFHHCVGKIHDYGIDRQSFLDVPQSQGRMHRYIEAFKCCIQGLDLPSDEKAFKGAAVD